MEYFRLIIQSSYIRSTIFNHVHSIHILEDKQEILKGKTISEGQSLYQYIKFNWVKEFSLGVTDLITNHDSNLTSFSKLLLQAVKYNRHGIVKVLVQVKQDYSVVIPSAEDNGDYLNLEPVDIEMFDLIIQAYHPNYMDIGKGVTGYIKWETNKEFDSNSIILDRVLKQCKDNEWKIPVEKIKSNSLLVKMMEMGVIQEDFYLHILVDRCSCGDLQSVQYLFQHPHIGDILSRDLVLETLFVADLPLPCLEYIYSILKEKNCLQPGPSLYNNVLMNIKSREVVDYILDRIDDLPSPQWDGIYNVNGINSETLSIGLIDKLFAIDTFILRCNFRDIAPCIVRVQDATVGIQIFNHLLEVDKSNQYNANGKDIFTWEKSNFIEATVRSGNLVFAQYLAAHHPDIISDYTDPVFLLETKRPENYEEIIKLYMPIWNIDIAHLLKAIETRQTLNIVKMVMEKLQDVPDYQLVECIVLYYDGMTVDILDYILSKLKNPDNNQQQLFTMFIGNLEIFKYLWNRYPNNRPSIPYKIKHLTPCFPVLRFIYDNCVKNNPKVNKNNWIIPTMQMPLYVYKEFDLIMNNDIENMRLFDQAMIKSEKDMMVNIYNRMDTPDTVFKSLLKYYKILLDGLGETVIIHTELTSMIQFTTSVNKLGLIYDLDVKLDVVTKMYTLSLEYGNIYLANHFKHLMYRLNV